MSCTFSAMYFVNRGLETRFCAWGQPHMICPSTCWNIMWRSCGAYLSVKQMWQVRFCSYIKGYFGRVDRSWFNCSVGPVDTGFVWLPHKIHSVLVQVYIYIPSRAWSIEGLRKSNICTPWARKMCSAVLQPISGVAENGAIRQTSKIVKACIHIGENCPGSYKIHPYKYTVLCLKYQCFRVYLAPCPDRAVHSVHDTLRPYINMDCRSGPSLTAPLRNVGCNEAAVNRRIPIRNGAYNWISLRKH